MDTYEILSLLFLGGSFLIALLAYIGDDVTIQSQARKCFAFPRCGVLAK